MTRFIAAALLLSGCALSHEIGHDAAIDVGPIPSGLLAPCAGVMAGLSRDCGWSSSGPVACSPGRTIRVGCSAGCGLGSCTGDSMIRVCDGGPCTFDRALASSDDGGCGSGGGVCSFIDGVTCPASGQLFVLTASYGSGNAYSCNVATR